jgi:hypothetical protein
MQEVTIESLQAELEQSKNIIKFFQAQMEAQKAIINEQMAASIQLRTNLHLMGINIQDKENQIKLLTSKLE